MAVEWCGIMEFMNPASSTVVWPQLFGAATSLMDFNDERCLFTCEDTDT